VKNEKHRSNTERLTNARTVRLFVREIRGLLLSLILPQSLYHHAAQYLSKIRERRDSRSGRTQLSNAIELLLGVPSDSERAREIIRRYRTRNTEENLGASRILSHRSWKIKIDLVGKDHLESALATGSGAILWGTSFCGNLIAKIGCHQNGIPLVHLSGWRHMMPQPPTLMGRRIVAPLRVYPEVRFVSERIIMPASGSLHYMRKLKQRLTENKCVWIYGENAPGRKPVSASLFGREYLLPTGAPSLAYSTGASLITVHVEKIGPAKYRMLFEKPYPRDQGIKKDVWVSNAVENFASQLEDQIRRHPSDWGGWESEWVAAQLEPIKRSKESAATGP
jgi:lauroyl/myristoyl acyltransferase